MANHHIVVADDDPHIRTLLVDVLEDEGYTVRACSDGLCALLEVRRIQPQLVILDVAMPAMTGDAVLRSLRDEGFPGPVLLATAATHPKRFLAAGATVVLPKPFDLITLLDVVARLLLDTSARDGLALGT